MEFYNGATLLATVLTPPYQFTWNNVGAGTYSLTAKAYSTRGLSQTSPAANVTVSVNQLPVVSLLTPANNSAVGPPGNVSLSAFATDPDGVVARVEFYRDSALVATTFDAPHLAEAYAGRLQLHGAGDRQPRRHGSQLTAAAFVVASSNALSELVRKYDMPVRSA